MKSQLLSFIDGLRSSGLPITLAESLDAVRAVGIVGVEPAAFREGLAAALVKDEADRPIFDAAFDRVFDVHATRRRKDKRLARRDEGEGGRNGQRRDTSRTSPPPEREAEPPTRQPDRRGPPERQRETPPRQLARKRTLLDMPFREMSALEIEACDALVAELAQRFRAYLSRRRKRAHRGVLDVRRTIRQSISKGGVPIEPILRHRRPGRPDLLALCDHSHSVATSSRFLTALLTPAQDFFRRVRLFAFVDEPVEISVHSGVVVPHQRLDLYARSDFGKVLVGLWNRYETLLTHNTILLVLGDARNNRRPPRADLLAKIHHYVRQVVWLNPEPAARWNSGDSVIRAYQPHCDSLLGASTLRELSLALHRNFRTFSRKTRLAR